MRKQITIVCILFYIFTANVYSQTIVDFQAGYSNIEHVSLGMGIRSQKNKVSVLVGSNFFVNIKSFSSYYLQYESLRGFQLYDSVQLHFGLKAGYSIYSNTYYSWNLLSAAPMAIVDYTYSRKIHFVASAGVMCTRILQVQRLAYGEIGWYRPFLPELKCAILYDL